MGCVITRSPEPHIIATNLKFHRPISECQTESAPDSTQKLASEQPTSEQQASQSGSPAHGSPSQGFLKQLRTLKSINTGTGKKMDKLDPFPKLILPSNNASLQDVSFKGGSLEGSFAHDMIHNAQTAGPSPSEMSHLKKDLQNLRVMKESTPCFAKPSSFRAFTPSLNNNHLEIVPQEGNQMSFGPLKESYISLAPSSEIPESKSSFRERQTSEEKSVKEKPELPKIVIPVDKGSLIFEEKDAKKDVVETKPIEKPTKPAKIPITVEKSSIVLEDKEVKKEETEAPGSMLKAKNINLKLQRLLLSDSMTGSGFGGNELKNPAKPQNTLDQKQMETSPSKTLSIFDTPFTTDSITKKSLDLPDHTMIAHSNTNVSIATISNLINLCKDVKSKDFEKKFRTNLVDLIKERKQTSGDSDSKRQQTGEKKRTSILIKNGRRFSGNNGSTLPQQNSSSQLSKSGFSNNLLNMMKDEESKTPQGPTARNKSVQIRHEDVFGDLAVPSPIRKADDRMFAKYPIPRLAQFHSTLNKYSEPSLQHDKSINFDEGLSRMDWDKYSIVEHINNVEIDDRSLSQTHLEGHLEGSIALDAVNNTQLNTSVTGTEILEAKEDTNTSNLLKSTSVPYNTKVEENDVTTPHRSTPHQTSRKTLAGANDTVSTLQYLSPQQAPRTLMVGSGRGRRVQTYCRADSQVVETNRVDVSVDDEGQKKINQYIMIKEIGRGAYGKVKLSFNVETKTQNAIKIANKKKLKRKLLSRQKSAYNQIASEIAIMKKLDHPNIVKLFEVIDCPSNDKLYLVMEYVKRGSVMSKGFWRQATRAKGLLGNPDDNDGPMFKKKMCLSETKAKKYFRHLALGLDFLHNCAEIVHRDIKPENLLISEDDVLKLSDFGISQIMQGDDLLENNLGTKYYLAPEAWEGKTYHGKPTDIWAAGGTLYYFLVGKPPFDGINPQDIQAKIQNSEPNYPEDLNPKAVELIKGCLKKDPIERLRIEEILKDPWLTNNGQDPLVNDEFSQVEVTEEEVSKALTKLRFMAAIRVMAKLKKTLNVSRRNIARRKTATVADDSQIEEVEKKKQAYQHSHLRSEKIMKKNRNDLE